MSSHHDVIVVGIGSMGAAACLHLAKRGASVLGIDSQPVPNTNSSYNGNTRVIRLTYQEHPDYVPLLKEAYRLWDEIEQETGTRLLHKTGVLYIGFPDGEAISGVKLASEKHDLRYSTLTHTQSWRSSSRSSPCPRRWSGRSNRKAATSSPSAPSRPTPVPHNDTAPPCSPTNQFSTGRMTLTASPSKLRPALTLRRN